MSTILSARAEAAFAQPRHVYNVLGCLMNNLELARNKEDLQLYDYYFPTDVQQIIFAAIYNLAASDSNAKALNPQDIDNYLENFPSQYEKYNNSKGYDYLLKCLKHCNSDTYLNSFDVVKKFALLRKYEEANIKTTDIYDYESDDFVKQTEDMKRLEEMTIEQIVDHFSQKTNIVRDEWKQSEIKNFKAGDNLTGLLERLKKAPDYGMPYTNPIYNTLFRGQRMKKFFLRSAGTGVGKTRFALADMLFTSCPEWYDLQKGWIKNPCYQPSMFLSTEIEQEELQTIMLAILTGVNQDVIQSGNYSSEIEQRLLYGIKILEQSPIYCIYIEDYSTSDIESTVEAHIIEHDIRYVYFDYIFATPKLMRTVAENSKLISREDQALLQLSSAIKLICIKYDIFLASATQLNRSPENDTSAIRGASSICDKIDFGVIVRKCTDLELSKVKYLTDKEMFEKPNTAHYVYKNRGGMSSVIIWTKLNAANMREEVCFVTSYDYTYIPLKLTKIQPQLDGSYTFTQFDRDEPEVTPF